MCQTVVLCMLAPKTISLRSKQVNLNYRETTLTQHSSLRIHSFPMNQTGNCLFINVRAGPRAGPVYTCTSNLYLYGTASLNAFSKSLYCFC